jgi:DNA invertase Pin-like site-specific DNA recombinase
MNPTRWRAFLLHIMAAFAELEQEIIRERVVAGVRAARANGKQLGRPKRVFRRDEAVRLREAGMSWRRIAHERLWSLTVSQGWMRMGASGD